MFSGVIEVEYWPEMGQDTWTFESIVWAPKSSVNCMKWQSQKELNWGFGLSQYIEKQSSKLLTTNFAST